MLYFILKYSSTIFIKFKYYLLRILRKKSKRDKLIIRAVKQVTGKKPLNIELYKLALVHSSIARAHPNGFKESNERLEYLGDAVLGMVVAEYLFKKYPYKEEGFLTEIRSRLVSREALNILARKIGLDALVMYDTRRKGVSSFKYLYGDAMEAFVGAVYLDRGFGFCKKFITHKLMQSHFDLDEIIRTTKNFKSKLIEWSQKHGHSIKFETFESKGDNKNRQFKVRLLVNEEEISIGTGFSKKKAEQDAARRACEVQEIL